MRKLKLDPVTACSAVVALGAIYALTAIGAVSSFSPVSRSVTDVPALRSGSTMASSAAGLDDGFASHVTGVPVMLDVPPRTAGR